MAIRVGMASLGCPKNQVDGEVLLSKLVEAGYELTPNPEEAQVIVVNTCGFIEDAKQEAIDTILELSLLKEEGCLQGLIVTGCLSERYREQLEEAMPEVDAVVGIGQNANIVEIVEQVLKESEKRGFYAPKSHLPLNGNRILINPPHYAYIKISEGCNNRCTYCAIPSIRGEMRSRNIEDIVAEAQTLAKGGVRELIVVAQDTTRYGEDIYGKCELPRLLTQLCKIEGIEWIRILYAYPDRITDELLTVMASEEKIVNYLDLPIQHCNGDVLKSMNRPGNRQALEECIANIREKVPGIVIRSTVMVGFPGETEEQFEELCEFLAQVEIPRLGCFVFSPEEGTVAAELEGQIPEEIGRHRQEVIMNQQFHITSRFAEGLVGKTLTVLVDEYDYEREQFVGRTPFDAPDIDCNLYFTAPAATIGDFMQVEITGLEEFDYIGKAVE